MHTQQYIDVDGKAAHILLTVANSYTKYTRAMTGTTCVYKNEAGRNCGLGMWFDPELTPKWVWDIAGTHTTLVMKLSHKGKKLDDILVEHARGLNGHFWRAIQALHDLPEHWDETGLSERGWQAVLRLATEIERRPELFAQ